MLFIRIQRLPLGILMVPSIYTFTGKWDGIMKFSSALGQRAHMLVTGETQILVL